MDKRVVVITASAALIMLCATTDARAQSPTMQPPSGQQPQQQTEPGGAGMGPGGMMGRGMMGRMMGRGGMLGSGMGRGDMMHDAMMRMIFALVDTDSDGTISLQEWQAAHERIFKAIDANKDGRLTQDEIRAFISGQPATAPQQ